MPFSFRSPTPGKRTGPIFISTPPNRIVTLLCKPDQLSVTTLHWDKQSNGSMLCLGDECPLCPGYSFEYTYGPGLFWSDRARRWLDGILCLGDPSGTLCQEDFQHVPIVIGKDKNDHGQKSRILFLGKADVSKLTQPPPKRAFDIRSHLLRRWGLFDEAALLGCQLHVPTPEEVARDQEQAG